MNQPAACCIGCYFYPPLTVLERCPQPPGWTVPWRAKQPSPSPFMCRMPCARPPIASLPALKWWHGATEQLHTQGRRLRNLWKGARETVERSSAFFFSILCALLCFLYSRRLHCMNVNVIKIASFFDIMASYAWFLAAPLSTRSIF
jgi:hypothetical protein